MTGVRDLGRVLVTGAAGFLGEALVTQLRSTGHPVVASDLGLQEAPCDLTDFAQVEPLIGCGGFQTIFHCGAVSGPMVLADRPLAIWQINALGTAHVLEAARLHGVGRVVVCSTADVYGDLTGVVDERTLPRPVTVYGASKLAAEAAMLGYVRQHHLDAVALRLSWIYGPGRRTSTMLETILRAAIAGHGISVDAAPGDITHYLYVQDAVAGLVRAGQAATLAERIYNITAGPGLAMRDVVSALMRLSPGCTVTLTGSGSAPLPAAMDNQRAARDLGFAPTTSLDQGLRFYRDALLR